MERQLKSALHLVRLNKLFFTSVRPINSFAKKSNIHVDITFSVFINKKELIILPIV